MVPILIRSKDRVDYLNTTLKSLTASDIDNSMIVIADDCSETDEMNAYLFSDNIIEIENKGWIDQITNDVTQNAYNYLRLDDYKEELTNFDLWNNYIGNIPYETKSEDKKKDGYFAYIKAGLSEFIDNTASASCSALV